MRVTLEKMTPDRAVSSQVRMRRSLFIKLMLLALLVGFYVGAHML